VFGPGAGFGGVQAEGKPGFGDHVNALVGEGEVADDVVVEAFGAGAVVADDARAIASRTEAETPARAPRSSFNYAGRFLIALIGHIGDSHARTLACERQRRGAADAAPSTGHECAPSCGCVRMRLPSSPVTPWSWTAAKRCNAVSGPS
jgi:hypothetical protein